MFAPSAAAPIEFVIIGLTRDGKRFRPNARGSQSWNVAAVAAVKNAVSA